MLQKAATDRKPFLKRGDLEANKPLTMKIVRSQLTDMKANKYREAGPVLILEFEGFDKAWIPNNTSINNMIDLLGNEEPKWRGQYITISRCTGFDPKDEMPDAIYAHPTKPDPEKYDSPMDANKPMLKTVEDEWPDE